MELEKRIEITNISKKFTKGIGIQINQSGFLVVDPLSAYLNSIGFENTIGQLPACEDHPLVLVLIFKDGSKFTPAGGDLKRVDSQAKNWMWL